MLNDNKYYYEDKHLYFWFDNHHSSEYNLFIIAKNDLKIENSTGASTQYNNAMFQEGTYLLGTSRKQKTFKRKVAAEGLSLEHYKQMMLWLREGSVGFLCFDSNPWWGWTVVLETVGDATVVYTKSGLIVEFDLTWKTVGSYLATNRYTSMGLDQIISVGNDYDITAGNEYGLPSYFCTGKADGLKYYQVVNLGNVKQCVDCSGIFKSSEFLIGLGSGKNFTPYAQVYLTPREDKFSISYKGETGFVFVDEQLAEEHPNFNQSAQTQGLMFINGPSIVSIDTTDYDTNSLLLSGYTYIIGVSMLNNQVTWGSAYPSAPSDGVHTGQNALQSSKVQIYSLTDNITPKDGYLYYAVSTQTIGVTCDDNDNITSLAVYSYNNL